ncbi:MAG: hypothetical protein IT425_10115 [Pirellulales bacterium]|nr:hypothetical protein [Pirellulales bacterium]
MRLHLGSAIIILALSLSQFSLSAPILDQSYDPNSGGGYTINSAATYAQLFQAGLSAPVAGIEARVLNYYGAATQPIKLDLWTVTGSYPETLGTNLASASIPQSLVPSSSSLVYFDLSSSNASFAAGQTYAAVLSTTSGYSYLWEGPSNGTYANGSGRLVSSGHVYYTLAGQNLDFCFKTYVIPEPSVLAIAAFGFVLPWIYRRNRAY